MKTKKSILNCWGNCSSQTRRFWQEAFELADNHITVKIPFAFEPSMVQANYDGLPQKHAAVLKTVRENPFFKINEIAEAVGLGKTRTGQIVADLKRMGRLKRIGGKKGGFWQTN